ncbi:selenoprotein N [Caerostris extrusa]|uniref:Selenoprotein N n=1 Tax=Caerostris extrusa TaxID=172846 RepID=A0AAV4U0D9_CAEEX|nr:selenoprotein N [Caerostris extrusa]
MPQFVTDSILCILASVVIFLYYNDYFLLEEFSDVRDVTNNIESIFEELDVDTDGVLNKEEFLMMKNSYTILQKNLYESHLKYTVQGFPYLDIELEEQVVNIDVAFTPLILNSLKKNISDVSEEEVGSLQGLLNWKKSHKERHPFGANSFSLFLPPRKNVQPGYTWWIVEPKIDKNSPPLSNQRYYPPQVPENLLVLHALLSLFHPHPFLWTRFQPQGTVAIVRAIEDNFYDIMFRMHAEFQLNKPPLHPFWFTPSQFQGRLIISKDATVVKFFYMGVPDTKLNVDMEWLNGPTEDSMEVDIGYMPQMSLISSAISVSSLDKIEIHQKLSSVKWNAEITEEEALNSLESEMFSFKKAKYYRRTLRETALASPPILQILKDNFISFWSTVADLEAIINENLDPAVSFLARMCLKYYEFPVESIVFFPNGSAIHRINANTLLGIANEQDSLFEIRDPIEKNYQEFLENALLMSKAMKVD